MFISNIDSPWTQHLCNPMDHSPPGSSVRILEWVAVPSSRGSSWPSDRTHVSYVYLHWQAGSLPPAPCGKPIIVGLWFFPSSGFADRCFSIFTINMFNFHKQSYFTILNQKLLCNDARAKKKKFSFHFNEQRADLWSCSWKSVAAFPHLNNLDYPSQQLLSQAIFCSHQACYQNLRQHYKEDVIYIHTQWNTTQST